MAPAQNPNGFPLKTLLALATAVGALALLHAFDHGKGLDPGIFASAGHVDLLRHPPQEATASPPPPPPPATGKSVASGQSTARPAISAYLEDPAGSLDTFYAALRRLQLPAEPGTPQVVTVLHYGDSPTTADLITGDVRAQLQQTFGDAGHGYLLIAKPWAWYGHRGVDLSDHDWTFSTAVGKGREETYGLGGASFTGGPGAGSHISLHDDPAAAQTSLDLEYWASPQGGTLSVQPDAGPATTVSTESADSHPAWHSIPLPAGTRSIDLKPASGQLRLFGDDLRTGRRGILYDSLGLNGASTSVLSNGFNAAAWDAELRHAAPAMVVINYGTNESSFGTYVDKQYEPTLRNAIARIRAAVPGVTILVMSPMDRGRRAGVDQIETYDTIPRLVAIERRVAAELGCAFFDTFDAMGGDGTMARWYTGHPRLVAGDLIHPTPQGASQVAGLFVKDLMVGYRHYLDQHPGSSGAAPLSSASQIASPAATTYPVEVPSHALSPTEKPSSVILAAPAADTPAVNPPPPDQPITTPDQSNTPPAKSIPVPTTPEVGPNG